MTEFDLSFSPSSSTDGGSYKLMELPPELCKLIEESNDNMAPLNFSVKGQVGEDAVLCTGNKTYTMRSVILSNSVLVITPPPDALSIDFSEDAVVIRDQVNEIIELTLTVPKLHKLGMLLKGRDYDESQEDDEANEESDNKFTYDDAKMQIQASDTELDYGLKERRILNLHGELRPISPSYLAQLLQLFLNLLVSLALPVHSAQVEKLLSTLAKEHEIPRMVSTQIMSWFGDINEGKWKVDIESVMKEMGLGILRQHKDEPIEKGMLLAKWKTLVGDTFEDSISLSLLSGNYLSTPNDANKLTYFPASSLPVDPAPRFADLFLTRSRWKGEDISPFLADIAINAKERDKLLLKFARGTTDAQGVWYTARAQYSG